MTATEEILRYCTILGVTRLELANQLGIHKNSLNNIAYRNSITRNMKAHLELLVSYKALKDVYLLSLKENLELKNG
jgi:plasmid maintenance system antidote protein VapI